MARSRARLLVELGTAIGIEQSGAQGENAEAAIASYRKQIDIITQCMREDARPLDVAATPKSYRPLAEAYAFLSGKRRS